MLTSKSLHQRSTVKAPMLEQVDRDENNFGLLRLLLALQVAFTHSFFFVDGTATREPLVRAIHLSLADIAVNGFFLISGFLVTKSYFQSRTPFEYLGKRVLRIYPGYILACAISLLIGAIAGGKFPTINFQSISIASIKVLFFSGVHLDNAFAHVPFPGINGSMWTIAYEFRCYLSLILLSYLGFFRSKYIVAGLVFVLLAANCFLTGIPTQTRADWFFGNPAEDIRFLLFFLTGSGFYLLGDRVRYRLRYTLLSAITLLFLLQFKVLATSALALLGGYVIFWLALQGPRGRFSRVFNETDLSYGFYLYAWPIGNLIVWFYPTIGVWQLLVVTTAISLVIAYVSWTRIEKPALTLKRHLTAKHGF